MNEMPSIRHEPNHERRDPYDYSGLYGRLFLASQPSADINKFIDPASNVDVPTTVKRTKKDYSRITQKLSSDERTKAWEGIKFDDAYAKWKKGVTQAVNGLTDDDLGKMDALRLIMSAERGATLTSANFTVEDARELFETFCDGKSNTDEFIKRTISSLTPSDITNTQKLRDLEWVSRKLFGQHTSEAVSRILELEVKIQNRPRTKTVKEAIFSDPTRVNNLNDSEKEILENLYYGLDRPPKFPSTGPTASRKPFDLKPLRIKEILEEEEEDAKAAAAADIPAPVRIKTPAGSGIKEEKTTEEVSDVELEGEDLAKKLMGEDFFGSDKIEKALKLKLNRDTIPTIPFSEEELKAAKANGQYLLLYVASQKDGGRITMQELINKATTKGIVAVRDELIKKYGKEDFFATETPRAAWRLVGKDLIPDSWNRGYLAQTQKIIEYLKTDIFNGHAIPTAYQEAIAEFEAQKTTYGRLPLKDYAKKMAELRINQMTRQSPVEVLYAELVYKYLRRVELLKESSIWTNQRTLDGDLIAIGFTKDGQIVIETNMDRDGNLYTGVVLSR